MPLGKVILRLKFPEALAVVVPTAALPSKMVTLAPGLDVPATGTLVLVLV